MKKLIITADDFGLALPVNEAVAESHRLGVLTTTSLMVGAPAAVDAVERARRLPSLRVGLHIVLVEGRPVLPPRQVPDLVDRRGEFSVHLVRAGFNFCRPGVRRQLEAEIRAQFEEFRKTGLNLDHANAHNHMHIHPTLMGLIAKIGRDYGLRSVRFPFEPPLLSWQATRRSLAPKLAAAVFLSPWLKIMRARMRGAGLRTNDRVFGIADSGKMTIALVLEFMRLLPEGVTEIYFHPATRRCPEIMSTMPEYRHEEEYKALIDPAFADAIAKAGAQRISFSDL